MPELPEVQMVCDAIWPRIVGKRIEEVEISHKEVLANCDLDDFRLRVKCSAFCDIKRRGKYIIFHLDSDAFIVVHLRMTGRLLAVPKDYPEEKHTHAVFKLQGRDALRFIDQRKFGKIWVYDCEKTLNESLSLLGPEPIASEITEEFLFNRLHRTSRAIKTCLMDQQLIAGIGNIYSDEILHSVKIAPWKPANQLTVQEYADLAQAIPQIMAYYVKMNRMSAEEYLQTAGKEYRNTPYFRVYGRAGQACLGCGAVLRKMLINGRSSVYCPSCQMLDENE